MSRRSIVHAVIAAASLPGFFIAGSASAQQTITIDVTALNANNCIGQVSCTVQGVALSTIPNSTRSHGEDRSMASPDLA